MVWYDKTRYDSAGKKSWVSYSLPYLLLASFFVGVSSGVRRFNLSLILALRLRLGLPLRWLRRPCLLWPQGLSGECRWRGLGLEETPELVLVLTERRLALRGKLRFRRVEVELELELEPQLTARCRFLRKSTFSRWELDVRHFVLVAIWLSNAILP